MFYIMINRQYFSARRGYFGGTTTDRTTATLFNLADAQDFAHRIYGARVVPA